MTALIITLLLSFTFGSLTSLGGERANRIFNANTAGGALLYVVALLSALGASLFAIAIIGTMSGTYPREVDRLLLSYAAGFALFTVVNRIRSSRR